MAQLSKKTISTSTSCRVVVLSYSKDTGKEANEIALPSVLNFYYQKSINSPYGEFSLEIPNIKNYYKIFSVGDWIGVYLNNGSDKESLRCLGNISRIQKRVSIANDGTKATTWQIFGYDYGKFLQTYKIYADPQILQDQIFQNTVAGNQKMLIGSSSSLIKSYINKYLLDFSAASYGALISVPEGFQKVFFPSNKINMNTIYSCLKLDNIKELSREATINLTLNVLQPLWTILKTLSNSVVNELFLEMDGNVGEEQPSVFLRPYPFSFQTYNDGGEYNNKFLSLPKAAIESGDILEQNLGLFDMERQNLFKIFSNVVNSNLGASVQVGPPVPNKTIFPDSIGRYGPCFATYTTSFADHGAADPVQLLEDWTGLLVHWYLNNHKLENGTVSIRGNPSVRVGRRLDIKGLYQKDTILKSYYIEGYMDQWQFPGLWTQAIQVNRGVVVSDGKEVYVEDFIDNPIESSSAFEDSKMRR